MPLGEFIVARKENNKSLQYGPELIEGVTSQGEFAPTKAVTDGINMKPYKVVRHGDFAYNPSRLNIGSLAYRQGEMCIVSHLYQIFYIKAESGILPEYLLLFFRRNEFLRMVDYHNYGSQRAEFNIHDISEFKIPVPYKDGEPDVERQKEVVDIWQGLRRLKEDNEALAAPLLELCQAKMDELKHSAPMVELGEYIHRIDERNKDNKIRDVKGISVTKEYREPTSKVDLNGNLSTYKIVRYNQFGFIQTTNNEKRLVVSLSKFKKPILISSVNEVFEVNSEEEIIPDFLQLWFLRSEVDRYGRYHSWGSARETFTWNDMCRMKVLKPSIEVQRAIVDIYHCARRAKEISEEASQQLKTICPALMQHIIHS